MMKSCKNVFAGLAVLVILSLSMANVSYGQDGESIKRGEFGIRFMPTYTSLDVKSSSGGSVSGDVVLGFGVGAVAGFSLSRNFAIQAELIYSSITQKSKNVNVENKINLRYVNIPVLLAFNSGKMKVINFNLVAGPQVGFNVGSSITTSGSNDVNNAQPILSVKKNDLGLAYGAGIDFGLNPNRNIRLALGYRGVLGLLDVSDNNNTTSTDTYYVLDRTHVKTNSIYAGVSLLF